MAGWAQEVCSAGHPDHTALWDPPPPATCPPGEATAVLTGQALREPRLPLGTQAAPHGLGPPGSHVDTRHLCPRTPPQPRPPPSSAHETLRAARGRGPLGASGLLPIARLWLCTAPSAAPAPAPASAPSQASTRAAHAVASPSAEAPRSRPQTAAWPLFLSDPRKFKPTPCRRALGLGTGRHSRSGRRRAGCQPQVEDGRGLMLPCAQARTSQVGREPSGCTPAAASQDAVPSARHDGADPVPAAGPTLSGGSGDPSPGLP